MHLPLSKEFLLLRGGKRVSLGQLAFTPGSQEFKSKGFFNSVGNPFCFVEVEFTFAVFGLAEQRVVESFGGLTVNFSLSIVTMASVLLSLLLELFQHVALIRRSSLL